MDRCLNLRVLLVAVRAASSHCLLGVRPVCCSNLQSAYRTHYSIESAVLKILADTLHALDAWLTAGSVIGFIGAAGFISDIRHRRTCHDTATPTVQTSNGLANDTQIYGVGVKKCSTSGTGDVYCMHRGGGDVKSLLIESSLA